MYDIRILSGALLILGAFAGTPCRADIYHDRSALQCDAAHNQAIVRLGSSWNDDAATFADLPTAYRAEWATVADPDNTECRLANGQHLVLKQGVGQSFAYGEGGGDPPAWISLWLDGRAILSHYQVKPGGGDRVSRVIDSLIYSPGKLRICDRESEWARYEKNTRNPPPRDADGCFAQTVRKFAVPYDSVQAYNRKADIGTLSVAAVYSPAFCQRFVFPAAKFEHGPRSNALYLSDKAVLSYVPLIDKDLAINNVVTLPDAQQSSPADDSDLSGHLAWDYFDFDNDGVLDTVIKAWDDRNYMDGDLYLVKRGRFPDAAAGLSRAPDYQAWAKANGFAVYSGLSTPYRTDRYTHLTVFHLVETTYLIATPTSVAQRPSAILYKPLPDGKLDELCFYQVIEDKF